MEKLNYEVLEKAGYQGYILKDAPVRVMQFGEGNFLRAFVDYWFDMANERAGWNGKISLVQPIAQGLTDYVNAQEGLYTLYLRGSEGGERVDRKRVISSVKDCLNPYTAEGFAAMLELAKSDTLEYIVSNTTEAGIVYDPETGFNQTPPQSFPGKLTRVLYERFRAGKPGVVVLSCELIDNNGRELKKVVERHIAEWGLGEDFAAWVEKENLFCSTLVDRIVPGRIRDQEELKRLDSLNGYTDPLTDVGEVFGVWYIEGPAELADRLPFKRAGLNVHVVPEVAPYKKRKVRILNGAHTGFVLGAYLAGFDIVRDCMHDTVVRAYMNKMLKEEIIPILPLDREDCEQFAAAVEDRFNNPFVDHQLLSISLNSTSKWRARNMPSLLEYVEKFGKLPVVLTMSLAAYIAFYSDELLRREEDGLIARRAAGNEYKIQDDAFVLDFYFAHRADSIEALVKAVLQNTEFWGQDLTEIAGLEAATVKNLAKIRAEGARAAYESVL
ncbi:tagaturonate reductase [Oribacterium sp. oral taxon 102]|uniref:tagaturonate reductase n=1 Tax=Oribacterium sp. oral taxon 102 TaxID=671214 RepID=UPI0015BBB97E|nr:tagaturonate reductase [Oribacterium sp. oral taxon 102]NWO22142.1 tagaturonate reductase [Oribacterium sp. oral taxon 102]